jgi:hypothetical protein
MKDYSQRNFPHVHEVGKWKEKCEMRLIKKTLKHLEHGTSKNRNMMKTPNILQLRVKRPPIPNALLVDPKKSRT